MTTEVAMSIWIYSVFFLFFPWKGIAIFCMLLTYYMWIKAVKTGSIYWSSNCALAYFYMVSVIPLGSVVVFTHYIYVIYKSLSLSLYV